MILHSPEVTAWAGQVALQIYFIFTHNAFVAVGFYYKSKNFWYTNILVYQGNTTRVVLQLPTMNTGGSCPYSYVIMKPFTKAQENF